jgi:dienelactone hydrolase
MTNNMEKSDLRAKLKELLGDFSCDTGLDIQIEKKCETDGFSETRYTFLSAGNERVPCHLLIPSGIKKPCPVVICLQGHSRGMHVSLNRPVFDGETEKILSLEQDFALQALKRGFAALVIEQAGMGERSGRSDFLPACHVLAGKELLYGRTLLGKRIFDISRAIGTLDLFSEIDNNKITCMGNSGGGTAAFYAACVDERIKAAMVSCSFCSYEKSIEVIEHCICNFIPGAKKWFEMADLTALIAPRPLIVVAGRHDGIFPLDGVFDAFKAAEKIYADCGASNNLKLIIGESGHRFYPEQGWKAFCESLK